VDLKVTCCGGVFRIFSISSGVGRWPFRLKATRGISPRRSA
jgi:hypothetical protein